MVSGQCPATALGARSSSSLICIFKPHVRFVAGRAVVFVSKLQQRHPTGQAS